MNESTCPSLYALVGLLLCKQRQHPVAEDVIQHFVIQPLFNFATTVKAYIAVFHYRQYKEEFRYWFPGVPAGHGHFFGQFPRVFAMRIFNKHNNNFVGRCFVESDDPVSERFILRWLKGPGAVDDRQPELIIIR